MTTQGDRRRKQSVGCAIIALIAFTGFLAGAVIPLLFMVLTR